MSPERLKVRRVEEGLAFHIRNQQAGQLILPYQEVYKQEADVEQVKTELRALNPINQKRKWIEQGALSKIVNWKKSALVPPKSHPASLIESYGKCGRTNYTNHECRVGTNKCMWCGSLEYLIVAFLRRLKAIDKGSHLKGLQRFEGRKC